jgi:hypothetical protein
MERKIGSPFSVIISVDDKRMNDENSARHPF